MVAVNNSNYESTGEVYKLLAGYRDSDGVTHTEFEIREMTGAEEEAIAKPDIKQNGGKIIRTILERCCIRIGTLEKSVLGINKWREVIQNLYTGDQDVILLRIREASIGTGINVSHECPNCKVKLETIIQTGELEIKPFKGSYEIDFELPRGYKDSQGNLHKNGKLIFPRGLDREILDPIARKNLGEGNTCMLVRCIKDFEGVACVHNEVVKSLVLKDRNYLFELFSTNDFGVVLNVDVVCESCSHEFKGSLNMTNFI